MKISRVKVRFSKYITETNKAYYLQYGNQKIWISKKICWDLLVAGNDLHAWATLPAWKFNEIIDDDIDEIYRKYGEIGLKETYFCQVESSVKHHIPEKIEPIKDNTIKDLAK